MTHTIVRQEDNRGELFVHLQITDETGIYPYAKWVQGKAYQAWKADESILDAIIEGLYPEIATFRKAQLEAEKEIQ